jgi:hypothetical protein
LNPSSKLAPTICARAVCGGPYLISTTAILGSNALFDVTEQFSRPISIRQVVIECRESCCSRLVLGRKRQDRYNQN